MSYHLLFALKLEQQDSQVFYDPEAFVGKPVVISVPEVEEIVAHLTSQLQLVAVVEKEVAKKDKNLKRVKFDSESEVVSNPSLIEKDLDQSATVLRSVAAEAYICKADDLKKKGILSQMSSKIADYLTKSYSEISSKDLLEEDLTPVFSGLKEVIDLRNYLLTFVENSGNKKMYREGYTYIMII